MFKLNVILVFVCFAFAISESAFVDTLEKCDYNDKECLTKVIQNVLTSIAKTGIPENDIPPIDPLEIKDVKLNMLNFVDVNVIEGTVKGLRNCELSDLKLNMEKGKFSLKLVCNITAKGKYEISGTGQGLKEITGGSSVHGNGNAKLKVDKVMIKFDFKFDLVKGSGGDIFINCKKDLAKYEYELLGGSKIQLDKLFVGDVESSQLVVNYYNENAKTLWKTFGKSIMDVAANMAYDFIHKFFANVPTKYFLSGDLTPFIKN